MAVSIKRKLKLLLPRFYAAHSPSVENIRQSQTLYRYIGRLQFYFCLTLMMENVATRTREAKYIFARTNEKQARDRFPASMIPIRFFFLFFFLESLTPARIRSDLPFLLYVKKKRRWINLYIYNRRIYRNCKIARAIV